MEDGRFQAGQELPGTVYRVLRHLATGGMGSVYEVEDVTVGKKYVLKTLHPNLVDREDLARRMQEEARTLAKLQHPNIVEVFTAGVINGQRPVPYYVMERLRGNNLRFLLDKKGALELLPAYRVAIDVADALEHAHENGIIHRDVKPENIFLHHNTNGTATTKLLDFGIMRILDRKVSHTHGKFIGTLRYASPEQITGSPIGPGTDIYSLGVVLFEMIAGRGPFDDAGDAYAIGAAHVQQPAPPLSRFVRGLPPELERLVAATLAKNPSERPRDCFTFSAELLKLWRAEEASPRDVTAVNPVSLVPDTRHGMHGVMTTTQNPRAVVTPVNGAPSIARDTSVDPSRAPVSRDPALAATVASGAPPPMPIGATAPLPIPAPPGVPAGIDRAAETRVSAGANQTRRLALNGTLMDVGEEAALLDERAPLEIPSGEGSDELVFPRFSMPSGTGPVAGEARTRPPERTNMVALGLASAMIGLLVGGLVLWFTKPWERVVKAHGGPASSATLTTASAHAPPPPPQPIAAPATAEPAPTTTATAQAAAPASASAAPPPSVLASAAPPPRTVPKRPAPGSGPAPGPAPKPKGGDPTIPFE